MIRVNFRGDFYYGLGEKKTEKGLKRRLQDYITFVHQSSFFSSLNLFNFNYNYVCDYDYYYGVGSF